jgi:hypothetical protein
MKVGMLPELFAAKPIEVFELVQLYCVAVPTNAIAVVF